MGNCLFLRARGWGIDHQVRAKLQMPGGGGMVTGRIEPCIKLPHLNSRQFIATIRSFYTALHTHLTTYNHGYKYRSVLYATELVNISLSLS